MKRIFCAIVALVASLSGYAELLCDEIDGVKFYYTIKDGEATLGDGSKLAVEYVKNGYLGNFPYGKFTIPAKLGGCPVTKLNRCALYNGSSYAPLNWVSEIVLPEGLKTIGDLAFGYCGFSSITIPGSVTSIGEKVFTNNVYLRKVVFNEGEGKLTLGDYALVARISSGSGPTTIIFHRDAPVLGNESIPSRYGDPPTIWVRPTTKGWGVSIPGKWQGGNIKYLKSIDFDAGIGSVSSETQWVTDGTKVGTLPTPTCPGHAFNGWYTAKSGGSKVTAETEVSENTVFYAQWTPNKYTVTFDANGGVGGKSEEMNCGIKIVAPEVTRVGYSFSGWYPEVADVVPAENVTYVAQWTLNRYRVVFDANGGEGGCSKEIEHGAAIGELSEPIKEGYAFDGWFTELEGGTRIDPNTVVTSDAIFYAHWIYFPYRLGGDATWIRNEDGSLRSGEIGDNEESWIEMTVEGSGRLTFKWKASTESFYDRRTASYQYYDYGYLVVDGTPKGGVDDDLALQGVAIGGEMSDWQEVTVDVRGGGEHVLRWVYEKDGQDDSSLVGEDCICLNDIVWTSIPDPIPELPASATTAEVAAALEGSADVNLAGNIRTAAEYSAYRFWALGLTAVTPEQVKASPNAWLSYALDVDSLIAVAPKEGDVVIDAFESTTTDGTFEFTVKIDGIEVGDNALEANIRKVFDIEGVEKLVSGGVGFSSDNVEVNAAAPENGNVKFTVTPKVGNGEKPNSFFFRVKMK